MQRQSHSGSRRCTRDIFNTRELSDTLWEEIWLFVKPYVDTTREYLSKNICECKDLAVFRDKYQRNIIAIASIDSYNFFFNNHNQTIIFTSNTLIKEEYRGCNILQKVGLTYLVKAKLRHPFRSAYWFFDTYSYKSYLLLPRNFVDYWPHYKKTIPWHKKQMINLLSAQRYGNAWSPEKGISRRVREKKLHPFVAPIKKEFLKNPHIAFYKSLNPHYADGDMLVCLCPLTTRNMAALFYNAIRRLF